MTNILISHPLETPKNQKPSSISTGTQNQKMNKKMVKLSDKIKTMEDLLQVKKTNK